MSPARCRADASSSGADTVTIVGRGRVGTTIGKMCESLGVRHAFVTRGMASFPPSGPIYVATHASDLDDVLALVPTDRARDLVLLQGGLLRDDFLERRGLAGVATQVALYMSASADGTARDGGGSTCACGPRARDVRELLTRGGNVRCAAVTEDDFRAASVGKLLWTSAFWLLCRSIAAERGMPRPMTVGEVVDSEHGAVAVRTLARELLDCAEASGELRRAADDDEKNDATREAITRAMFEYSRSIPSSVPSLEMALKEGGFRNGWFLARRTASSPQRTHETHLRRIGVDPDVLATAHLELTRSSTPGGRIDV